MVESIKAIAFSIGPTKLYSCLKKINIINKTIEVNDCALWGFNKKIRSSELHFPLHGLLYVKINSNSIPKQNRGCISYHTEIFDIESYAEPTVSKNMQCRSEEWRELAFSYYFLLSSQITPINNPIELNELQKGDGTILKSVRSWTSILLTKADILRLDE